MQRHNETPRLREACGSDVLVLEVAQQFDLAQDTLGIDEIIKCLRNLLDGNL
jgi:hypothetical protein